MTNDNVTDTLQLLLRLLPGILADDLIMASLKRRAELLGPIPKTGAERTRKCRERKRARTLADSYPEIIPYHC
jgi:hypothetical protein